MQEQKSAPKVTRLQDYTPPAYRVETVELTFELEEDWTKVTTRLQLKRNPDSKQAAAPLVLNGEKLHLLSVVLDGKPLTSQEYQLDDEQLIIPHVPEQFSLETVTQIKPQENTELSGLYRSNDIFCTQCEAEGFRRITYYPDRPDVLARYTTTIIADKTRYPILLSNGNLIAEKQLPDNRHSMTWQDPFKKPSYLFALVAGDLDFIEDKFTTQSGRDVVLRLFVNKGQASKAGHAMESLKKAMRWDEQAYGREYDLDIYMIVAIADFNMGAMENKGLNLFNDKYILANPETATDGDYQNIMLVVGHEYLHNWSGNRVTCRDWFQLSLKEGLTVFREQEFTADMTSHGVERINTVRALRNSQFREDAGPLAHPVQPDSYIEINNFYTTTIYNKGAEVIRMMKTLLGADLFRQGMDLYFARNDGAAVTIEELVAAMEEVSGRDLQQFRRWYHQAGTPELTVTSAYDEDKKTLALTIKQACPPTPNQPTKEPFHIPLAFGLLDKKGHPLPQVGEGKLVLELKQETETFTLVNIPEQPILSLLRGFSAPVKLHYEYTDEELHFLLLRDTDFFGRWEAGQKLASRVILRRITEQQKSAEMDKSLSDAFRTLLQSNEQDKAFLSELLVLPPETYLGELMPVVDVDGIYQARKFVRQNLARQLHHEFLAGYENNIDKGPYQLDLNAIAERKLKNTCLAYLMQLNDSSIRQRCKDQFYHANNMTDQLSAVSAFSHQEGAEREEVLNAFYTQWQHEPLVIDMWFAIQARSECPNTLEKVKQLLKHPQFQIKNPNRVRALIGTFCSENQVQFHAINGEGYAFLGEQVALLDPLNPQSAARLLTPLTLWRRYDKVRQDLMQKQLEALANKKGLSNDVYEIVTKSLGGNSKQIV